MILNWVNCMIGFHVDYTRLVYYRRQLWNRSACCRYCKVYNTLKESRLGFWTVVKHVAYFATVNTSVMHTMVVEFISRQTLLGLVLGVAISARNTPRPFRILVKRSRLNMPFKVCFNILSGLVCPHGPLLVVAPLLPLPPKLPWLPELFCPKFMGWGCSKFGCGIGLFPLFWYVLERLDLGVITVDDRYKLFLASSVYNAISVAYLPACKIDIRSARIEPFLGLPKYKYEATFAEMSSFQ